MMKASIAGLETTFDAFKKRACARTGIRRRKTERTEYGEEEEEEGDAPAPFLPRPQQTGGGRARERRLARGTLAVRTSRSIMHASLLRSRSCSSREWKRASRQFSSCCAVCMSARVASVCFRE
jgi:hypothetical protein